MKYSALLVFLLSTTLFAQTFSGGTGTVGEPYQLSTTFDIEYLSTHTSYWDKHFELSNSITFDRESITSIGSHTHPFSGTIEGNNYTLSGVKNGAGGAKYIGFVGYAEATAEISNIHLNSYTISGGEYVGGIVGYNKGTLRNVSFTGTINVNSGHGYGGGLVGYNDGGTITNGMVLCSLKVGYDMDDIGGIVGYSINGTLDSLWFNGVIQSTSSNRGYNYGGIAGKTSYTTITNAVTQGILNAGKSLGGIVGHNYGDISNSVSMMDVISYGESSGGSIVGGFVGHHSIGIISDAQSYGRVYGGDRTGGFVGYNGSGIVRSSTFGTVDGKGDVGGFVGNNTGEIEQSFARGTVYTRIGTHFDPGGGFVGLNYGTITMSYATGEVTGEVLSRLGGFAGDTISEHTIENVFWDTLTTGNNYSREGTPKNTTEMQSINTYTDLTQIGLTEAWDFVGTPNDDAQTNDYWWIDPSINDGYPALVETRLLQTLFVTHISDSSVTISGWANGYNQEPSSSFGFCLSTHVTPTMTDECITVSIATNGTLQHTFGGLSEDQRYFVRAFGIFNSDTVWGSIRNFSTYTITSVPVSDTITYGDILWDYQLRNDTVSIPGIFFHSHKGEILPVGTWKEEIVFMPTDTMSYTIQKDSVEVTVLPLELSVSGIVIAEKEYDGSTATQFESATYSWHPSEDLVWIDSQSVCSFNSVLPGDSIPVTVNFTLAGADASNYTLASPPLVYGTIHPKTLTVINAVAENKYYDTTESIYITGAELYGVLSGDIVTLINHTIGTVAGGVIGEAQSVSTTMALSGVDTAHYVLAQPDYLTASIIAPLSSASISSSETSSAAVVLVSSSLGISSTIEMSSSSRYFSSDQLYSSIGLSTMYEYSSIAVNSSYKTVGTSSSTITPVQEVGLSSTVSSSSSSSSSFSFSTVYMQSPLNENTGVNGFFSIASLGQIKIEGAGLESLSIIDAVGRIHLVKHSLLVGEVISYAHLPDGLYIVTARDALGFRYSVIL